LPSALILVPFLVTRISVIREERELPFKFRPYHEKVTGRPAPPLASKAPIKNEAQAPTTAGATNPTRGLSDELEIVKTLKFVLESDFSSRRKMVFDFEVIWMPGVTAESSDMNTSRDRADDHEQ
jgi:hypothetical protein